MRSLRFTKPTYYAASVMLILALARGPDDPGVLETAALIALLLALNEALVMAIGSLTTLVPLPAMQKILVSWCCCSGLSQPKPTRC